MTFHAYRSTAFDHTHENKAFDKLYELLKAQWAELDEPLHLFGNFYVDGCEIDALVIKRNAFIVIDFKDYGGTLEVTVAAEPTNLECSLSILGSNGFLKIGGKAMNIIESANFLSNGAQVQYQNLIDNYHKKNRRGRGAPLNMVITETGASSAVVKLLPELEGKLTGNAIRVPTPNVSMAILNLNLETEVEREELNDYLRHMALHSDLQKQIDYTDSPEAVSSDFVGSRAAGVVDGLATVATGKKNCVVYVWYDNEFGYSCQVIRMLQHVTNTALPAFPIED